MVININDKFRISSNVNQWILEETWVNSKTNQTEWKVVGYFNRLSSVLKFLPEYALRLIEGGMEEAAKEIKQLRKDVNKALKPMKFKLEE